jgi:hypothetical protein
MHLRIGVTTSPPLVTEYAHESLFSHKLQHRTGVDADTLALILNIGHIPYEIVSLDAVDRGLLHNETTMTGLANLTDSGYIDTAAMFWIQNTLREKYFTFSHPFEYSQGVFIVAKGEDITSWDYIVQSVKHVEPELLVLLTVTLVVLIGMILIYDRLIKRQPRRRTIWEYLRYIVACGDIEAEEFDEGTFSGTVLFMMLSISLVILSGQYTSQLLSNMLLPVQVKQRFDDVPELAGLLAQSSLILATNVKNSWFLIQLEQSNDTSFRLLREAVTYSEEDTAIFEVFEEGAAQRIINEQLVYFCSTIERCSPLIEQDKACQLEVIRLHEFPSVPIAFMFRKTFPSQYMHEFNEALELARAPFTAMRSHYSNFIHRCRKDTKTTKLEALKLQPLSGSFLLLCFGYLVAAVAFISVKIAHVTTTKRRRKLIENCFLF